MVLPIPVSRHRVASVRVQEPIGLCDQRIFQDNSSLFIFLRVVVRELIAPAQLRPAALAHDIADHMASREHHSILDSAEGQVDDALEEIRSS